MCIDVTAGAGGGVIMDSVGPAVVIRSRGACAAYSFIMSPVTADVVAGGKIGTNIL